MSLRNYDDLVEEDDNLLIDHQRIFVQLMIITFVDLGIYSIFDKLV